MYELARDITKDGHNIPKGVRLSGVYEVGTEGQLCSQVYWDGDWVKLLLWPADVCWTGLTERQLDDKHEQEAVAAMPSSDDNA